MTRPSTKLRVSIRICDSPSVKELVASTLKSYGNNKMRERGVDIAILGIDIAILGVDRAILRRQEKRGGATGRGRGRHSGPRCRHSKPEGAREKGRGYRGREEGEVSRTRRLEAGWIARESDGTKSRKRRGAPCYKPRA